MSSEIDLMYVIENMQNLAIGHMLDTGSYVSNSHLRDKLDATRKRLIQLIHNEEDAFDIYESYSNQILGIVGEYSDKLEEYDKQLRWELGIKEEINTVTFNPVQKYVIAVYNTETEVNKVYIKDASSYEEAIYMIMPSITSNYVISKPIILD